MYEDVADLLPGGGECLLHGSKTCLSNTGVEDWLEPNVGDKKGMDSAPLTDGDVVMYSSSVLYTSMLWIQKRLSASSLCPRMSTQLDRPVSPTPF